MPRKPLTVSVTEAGKMLSCGRNVAYRLAKEGVIPVIKVGKKLRVPRMAMERMLKQIPNKAEEK